ncbi:TetR/AcrR family transcriptional regulator [Tabrizicola oligotrophica]|uniref:TetR/AcrR family transcriptional regulator n=1 Tax=Tabrizicola oligotrophica TaxID=2710650 RepID=A0A6M0QXJ6_9RHOB|nr:TetR/AcrR family transcriptional regulator [Tabrizicola oligotrophica]NEY92190.1 TetR/AcrR family transcriptional regulator [Tabrizicola oligotrophica]
MPSRKPAEDRKAEIVGALLRLADRIGPDRLTTNDIAREIGITQAAIFRHFPTKAELWLAVAEVVAQRLEAAWLQALAEAATPQDRLRALIAAQLLQIETCPALPAILHSRELNAENAALRDRFRGLLLRFQGHLADTIDDMAAAGAIGSAVRSPDAAVLLTSLVQGVAIRWSLGSRGFALQTEGLRLFEVQLGLLAGKVGAG